MSIWSLLLISVLSTVASVPVTRVVTTVLRLDQANFRGERIPSGFGILIVIAAAPPCVILLLLEGNSPAGLILATLTGFGLLGLIDDIYGTREAGGFKGHLGLLRQGKVSTGLLKLLAGGAFALAIGMTVADFEPIVGVINGLIIALLANMLNLLDLRPGRAVSCYWLGLVLLLATRAGRAEFWHAMVPTYAPAVLLTWLDRSAKVMLGDAGSNALGALLGLAVISVTGLPVKIAVLLSIVLVHIYTEKRSISVLIESNRVLRAIDRVLGER